MWPQHPVPLLAEPARTRPKYRKLSESSQEGKMLPTAGSATTVHLAESPAECVLRRSFRFNETRGLASASSPFVDDLTDSETPLRHYLRLLRRQAWLVIFLPALTLGVTAVVVFTQHSVYRATMKIVVAQAGGQSQPDFGSQQLSQTMKTLLESDVVAKEVIDNVGLETTPPKLLKKVHVSFRPDSSVLDVSYDSTSKPQALAVLDEYRKVFIRLVDENLGVRSRGSVLGGRVTLPGVVVNVFDPPHLQPDAISPKPAKTLGFAGALGLALGLMLAFARESLDDRVRGWREAEEWFGAPVVGTLPKRTRGTRPAGVAGRGRESESLLEALNLLRANLEFSPTGVAGPTILVTSALSGEGKTTVAANLGSVLAMGGHTVICVEADLRRPAAQGGSRPEERRPCRGEAGPVRRRRAARSPNGQRFAPYRHGLPRRAARTPDREAEIPRRLRHLRLSAPAHARRHVSTRPALGRRAGGCASRADEEGQGRGRKGEAARPRRGEGRCDPDGLARPRRGRVLLLASATNSRKRLPEQPDRGTHDGGIRLVRIS